MKTYAHFIVAYATVYRTLATFCCGDKDYLMSALKAWLDCQWENRQYEDFPHIVGRCRSALTDDVDIPHQWVGLRLSSLRNMGQALFEWQPELAPPSVGTPQCGEDYVSAAGVAGIRP